MEKSTNLAGAHPKNCCVGGKSDCGNVGFGQTRIVEGLSPFLGDLKIAGASRPKAQQ